VFTTLKAVAKMKGVKTEEVAEIAGKNAFRFLNLEGISKSTNYPPKHLGG
jgi:hypothetical protein